MWAELSRWYGGAPRKLSRVSGGQRNGIEQAGDFSPRAFRGATDATQIPGLRDRSATERYHGWSTSRPALSRPEIGGDRNHVQAFRISRARRAGGYRLD